MTRAGPFVLGMDLGTSSLKCVIMDGMGQLRASVERSYPTHVPHPGWAEQHPADWVEALTQALRELQAREPALMAGLEAAGLCSAAHIPVLLDEHNAVIRPAILWSDQRSETQVRQLSREHGALLEQTTLNEAGCTWTLPQLLWVWQHEPAVRGRVRRLLSSKDYLVWVLTGNYSMDPASAAATLMFDARAQEWSPAVVALSSLPQVVLPQLHPAMATVGVVTGDAAERFGLPKGLPIISGTLDSAAEMVGCGILAPAQTGMVRVGSAGGVMVVTERPAFNKGVITYPHIVENLYYKQAATNACATSLKWIRDLCGAMRGGPEAQSLTYEDLDHLAGMAPPGADGLIFHPYIQGERAPYWNAELRGSFTGIDRRHGWPELVRAVMEGVAFSLRDCLTLFRRDGLDMTCAVMAGGVVKSPVWSQIITDVLGLPTHTVRHGDSAWGMGMLCATAVGMFDGIADAAAQCVVPEGTLSPDPSTGPRYDELFRRYARIGRFFDAFVRE